MNPEEKTTQDRVIYLSKREAKLTKENKDLLARVTNLEEKYTKLAEALRRCLPHMELGDEF